MSDIGQWPHDAGRFYGKSAGSAVFQLARSNSGQRRTNHFDQQSNQSSIPSFIVPEAPRSTESNMRKFTACEACRKQKIRCDMPTGTPPCAGCQRRNRSCITSRGLKSLNEDVQKVELLTHDIVHLHRTLDDVCSHLELDVPRPLLSKVKSQPQEPSNGSDSASEGEEPDCEILSPTSPSIIPAPIDTFLEVAKLGSPGSMGQSLSSRKPSVKHDLVSKGIISATDASRLLESYFNRLDHYLYGIASMYKDMSTVRQASSILFAAMCTVSALHEPGPDQTLYESCNRELRRLVCRSVFERTDIEFIRAMVISSFWLSDASRIFSANGIRRAADARLHRAFRQAVSAGQGKACSLRLRPYECVDRVRLWYLLFVSDQHMSVIHNRDSLLRVDREITHEWELFLERPSCVNDDVRVLSQTSLLLIMGQVRDTLGVEPDECLSTSMAGQLRSLSYQLDKWHDRFFPLFRPDNAIGGFPAKDLQLHFHFSKLHLGQHVFQGLRGHTLPLAFVPAATTAHDAALAIFEMIANDQDLQEDLVGTPFYFHVMIAFAGHFMLELCSRYSNQLPLNVNGDLYSIRNVLSIFDKLSCIPQHPIRRMTPGLGRKLLDCATKMNILLPAPLELQAEIFMCTSSQRPTSLSGAYESFQFPHVMTGHTDDGFMANFGEFQFPDMGLYFTS